MSEKINYNIPQEPIKSRKEERPILEYSDTIEKLIEDNQNVIVIGPTGSGKTTELPLMIAEVLGPRKRIAITEPRRGVARSVCEYVSGKFGSRVGDKVGYWIRFDKKANAGTQITFLTEGILFRQIQDDPLLTDYSAIMLDEAHERNINADILKGALKLLRKLKIREKSGLAPLKEITASATLEKEKFIKFDEGENNYLEVPGKLFPIDVLFMKEEEYKKYLKEDYKGEIAFDYINAAADSAMEFLSDIKENHDILIFMPGKAEIGKTIDEIKRRIEEQKLRGEKQARKVTVLPLYGELSYEEQDYALYEDIEERKIIVATNIAETGHTPKRPVDVIDSTVIKQTEYDPKTGFEYLVTRPHAQSGLIQRRGRAGRLEKGRCKHLCTEKDFKARNYSQIPEIQRSNLNRVVLYLKKFLDRLGAAMENLKMDKEDIKTVLDARNFPWIDTPKPELLEKAISDCKSFGALDEEERITKVGEFMADLPLEPKLARMVVEAQKNNCVEAVCTITPFLSGRSVFRRPPGKEADADAAHKRFKTQNESDFLVFLKIWKEFENSDYDYGWAKDNFLNFNALMEVGDARYQLFKILKRKKIFISREENPEAIEKSVAAGLIENLMEYDYKYSYRRIKDNTSGFFIHPSSAIFGRKKGEPQFFTSAEIVPTKKQYARNCQEIKPEWIKEIAPQIVKEESTETFYDSEKDKVFKKISLYFKTTGSKFLEEKREIFGEEAVGIFAEFLASGRTDFAFTKKNKRVVEELNDLWRRAEGKIRAFSKEDLIKFYAEKLGKISSQKELSEALEKREINLELNIDVFVSSAEREKILRDNPDNIEVQGKSYEIHYKYDDYKNEFSAGIKIPAETIFKLNEIPKLPSGKKIIVEITEAEGEYYGLFSGVDLNELKQKSRRFLLDKQWDKWKNSRKASSEERIENFDIFGETPKLPEPIQFGADPETNEPIFAYPAFDLREDALFTQYFQSKEKALEKLEETKKIIEQNREQKLKEKEKERLLAPSRELLRQVKEKSERIGDNYSDFGLSYEENNVLQNQIFEAEKELEKETKKTKEILEDLNKQLEKALEYGEKLKESREKINQAMSERYSKCPLCGNDLSMSEGVCMNNEHNSDLIDYALDEEGYESSPALLSRIVTDKGEVIAELWASAGSERYYRGDIYLKKWPDIENNSWQGKPFESLKFENFQKILTSEQAEKRKKRLEEIKKQKELEEARQRYEDDLKFANEEVKEGNWKIGRFSRGRHPKTGEEQWELTLKDRGLKLKYIVNRYGRQPSSGDLKYFFSIDKTIVETKNFKLIIVNLEYPFPEDKPEMKKNVKPEEKTEAAEREYMKEEEKKKAQETKSERGKEKMSTEEFKSSLDALKKKWERQ